MVETAFRGVAGDQPASSFAREIATIPSLVASPTADEAEDLDFAQLFDSDASPADSLEAMPSIPNQKQNGDLSEGWLVLPTANGAGEEDAAQTIVESRAGSLEPFGGSPEEFPEQPAPSPVESIAEPGGQTWHEEHFGTQGASAAISDKPIDSDSTVAEPYGREYERAHTPGYTADQLPLLVDDTKREQISKLRAPMIALVLAGLVAAVYFLVYQPSTRGERRSGTISADLASATSASIKTEAPASPSDSQSPASARSSETSSAQSPFPDQAAGASEAAPGGGFSLQAAAVPTRPGAEEFAERLRRAGVPAYVVRADVGRRGTWFRVRVGRFESPEAAKAYSGEAQRRGKAAGISLQLILCQYEQQ